MYSQRHTEEENLEPNNRNTEQAKPPPSPKKTKGQQNAAKKPLASSKKTKPKKQTLEECISQVGGVYITSRQLNFMKTVS